MYHGECLLLMVGIYVSGYDTYVYVYVMNIYIYIYIYIQYECKMANDG